jgi:hypothetical protein
MEKEKSMKHLLLVVIAVVLLAGCSTPVRQIEISAKPIDKPELVLPPIEQLRLKDVEWVVINQENAKEVFAQLLEDKKDPVLGYEILSLNYSDIMSHIQQQNAIIKAYRNYYEESEQALENANSQIEGAQAEVEEQNNAPKESTLDKLNPFK